MMGWPVMEGVLWLAPLLCLLYLQSMTSMPAHSACNFFMPHACGGWSQNGTRDARSCSHKHVETREQSEGMWCGEHKAQLSRSHQSNRRDKMVMWTIRLLLRPPTPVLYVMLHVHGLHKAQGLKNCVISALTYVFMSCSAELKIFPHPRLR